jgi:ABC-2 type transport system permease protein
MNRSVVQALILKDWRLQRPVILTTVGAGAIALSLLQLKSETAGLIGIVWFFVALMVLACMLPVSNVINERKKQSLAFLMSFPLSACQYGMAKMVSTIGLFLVPWAALGLAASAFILSHHEIPNGIFPLTLALLVLVLVGFCIIGGVALASESEGWTIAATIVCNSSYGLAWTFIIRNPAINGDLKSPVAVWSPAVLELLAAEFVVIALMLGLTFFFQSRKRNFV